RAPPGLPEVRRLRHLSGYRRIPLEFLQVQVSREGESMNDEARPAQLRKFEALKYRSMMADFRSVAAIAPLLNALSRALAAETFWRDRVRPAHNPDGDCICAFGHAGHDCSHHPPDCPWLLAQR